MNSPAIHHAEYRSPSPNVTAWVFGTLFLLVSVSFGVYVLMQPEQSSESENKRQDFGTRGGVNESTSQESIRAENGTKKPRSILTPSDLMLRYDELRGKTITLRCYATLFSSPIKETGGLRVSVTDRPYSEFQRIKPADRLEIWCYVDNPKIGRDEFLGHGLQDGSVIVTGRLSSRPSPKGFIIRRCSIRLND